MATKQPKLMHHEVVESCMVRMPFWVFLSTLGGSGSERMSSKRQRTKTNCLRLFSTRFTCLPRAGALGSFPSKD